MSDKDEELDDALSIAEESDDEDEGEMSIYEIYDGYTKQELAGWDYVTKLDAAMLPLFFGLYLLLAWGSMGFSVPQVDPVSWPAWVIGIQVLVAILSCYIMWLFIMYCAFPTEQQGRIYYVQKKLGRWVFLTRHACTLQMVHLVLSVAASFVPFLVPLTHGSMGLFIAGLSTFVTIQFYSLVGPDKDYKKDCATWRRRGVPFKKVQYIIHSPLVWLALLDIAFAKNREIMFQLNSIIAVFGIVAAYVVIYIGIIVINYNLTDHWPYGFMVAFGTNIGKWGAFLVAQILIISIFVFAFFGLIQTQALWT